MYNMNLIICVGVFGIMLVVCYGQTSNRHMICKDVDDVFSENGGAVSQSRRLQGPPGKKGEPGMKGERGNPGIPGQPGIVDYDRLNEIVQAKVKLEIKALESKVEKMEHYINSTIQEEKEEVEEREQAITADKCTSTYSGFIYDRKCYWGEDHARRDTNLAQGKQLCTSKDSTLADIYTKEHFDLAMNLLRSKITSRGFTVIWTAMKKKFEDPVAYLSSGEAAEYTKVRSSSSGQWSPATKDRTQVYLYVNKSDPKNSDQGMGAIYPHYNAWGVLCRVV